MADLSTLILDSEFYPFPGWIIPPLPWMMVDYTLILDDWLHPYPGWWIPFLSWMMDSTLILDDWLHPYPGWWIPSLSWMMDSTLILDGRFHLIPDNRFHPYPGWQTPRCNWSWMPDCKRGGCTHITVCLSDTTWWLQLSMTGKPGTCQLLRPRTACHPTTVRPSTMCQMIINLQPVNTSRYKKKHGRWVCSGT